ncbi:MAG: hypothetical protein H6R10_1945 [Rhodocyclaceae bacterium]|nr:hypothetical protein [Rhodocyclaceae bacterium]
MTPLRFAWQNVLRNRRRSLMTILLTALGCASALIAGGFALYTYESLEEGAARESGHLLVAHPDYFSRDEETPLQYGLTDSGALVHSLQARDEVKRILPRLNFSGLISNGDKSVIFLGQGVDLAGEVAARGTFLQLQAGELPADGGTGGTPRIVVGEALARSLNARPGSSLTLLATTVHGTMNAQDVEVAGIVATGVPEVDKRLVYGPLPAVQRLLQTERVSTLAVYVDDIARVPAYLADWQAGDPRHAYRPWWEEAFYYQAVRALYNRIFGLLGFIIAALVFFAVTNTLAMAVLERTREIGTQRALGASPWEITAQFIREGLMIGACGVALGMLAAGGITLALRHLGLQMPPPPGRSVGYPLLVSFSPSMYALAGLALLSLCGFAAWLVSRKAAARPIVEALTHV